MRIVLNGALGRMGRMVLEAAAEAKDEVVALVERKDHPQCGKVIETPWGMRKVLANAEEADEADVAIDFSTPEAAASFAEKISKRGIAVLSGTTGLSDAQMAKLCEAAKVVPVLWTPNTSIGIFCLHELCALAKGILGDEYDIEIVEIHHRLKKDAPSGTALSLARHIGNERVVTGRSGTAGPRSRGEIGVLAVRGGEVVGEHTVYFLGRYDRLEITHRVASRRLFADGALALARRLLGRQPGFYSVRDLLMAADAHLVQQAGRDCR